MAEVPALGLRRVTSSRLEDAAAEFVSRLDDVVAAAINTDAKLVMQLNDDNNRVTIDVSRSFGRSLAFPLLRQNEDPDTPALLLKANYVVAEEGDRAYPTVVTSNVGLWVDVTGGRKKHRPLVRLEYDRYPRAPDRPAMHVHLHANSPEMAWVYGSSGLPAPDLHALHFPVGGEQFQPTFEDFLLFLNREKLYTDFKSNWRPEVLRSLREWKDGQVEAVVKRSPKVAVGVLERLGYRVA